MYIKKSVLVICSILLIVATALGTVMLVNPFGAVDFADFLKLNMGFRAMREYFYEETQNKKLLDGALLGLSYSVNDPYTVYMNEEESESFQESVDSDDYTGIGLYITNNAEDNTIMVVSPLSGSPAEKAGLVSGDKIVKVNGEAVYGADLNDVAANLKGKEGTEVKITVLKKQSGETVELSLNRSNIKRETVSSKMIDGETGYIQITQFGINTYEEFAESFNGLVEKDMKKLVIDLRNNPGGYVEVAVQIADTFIDSGDIVYTLNRKNKKRVYKAEKGAVKIPIAVLTNGGSASASEILVGALRDNKIAKSVGEKTFGKGVTQIPFKFFDGSIIKITDSRYYTPSGVCIDKEGIKPDVEVKMSEEKYADLSSLDFNEDDQLKMAVEVLKK